MNASHPLTKSALAALKDKKHTTDKVELRWGEFTALTKVSAVVSASNVGTDPMAASVGWQRVLEVMAPKVPAAAKALGTLR